MGLRTEVGEREVRHHHPYCEYFIGLEGTAEFEVEGAVSDMIRVSRAMQEVYRPLKMNYQLLGNRVAHLHWILAPRFLDDVAPGDPIPGSGYHKFPEDEVQRDVVALREALIWA